MNRCPNCTLPIESTSKFCGVCGTRVDEPEGKSEFPKTLIAGTPPAEAMNSKLFDDDEPEPERKPPAGIMSTLVDPDPGPKVAKKFVDAMPATTVAVAKDAGHPKTIVASPPAAAVAASADLFSPSEPAAAVAASADLFSPSEPAAVAVAASPDLFSPTDPLIGQTLNNRFVIESKLGEGGFGAVYKGIQKVTNRVVAIKLLHPEMTRDKNVVERFRREGLVLCSLKDAHTVTTFDFDQTPDGTLFLAMELLEGQSLHDIFARDAPIEWRRMLKIISEMCSSLAEAHAMGIVHRDLKPENVHLEKRSGNDEFVKILDFGIAKMLGGDGSGSSGPQLTAMGQTLGTLEYMSPEQLMGTPLDGRSDVYAMGVLAHELMTGALPFPDAVGPALLITAQLKTVPPAVSSVQPNAGIPAEVDELVLKMLGKSPDDRFANVTELRDACLQLLRQKPSESGSGAPNGPVSVGANPVAAKQPYTPNTPLTMPTPKPNRPPIWVWLAVASIVIGGGVAVFFLSS